MTDLATLPLTSDDAAPVNPFAAAMLAEHFELRLDYLGRPLDGPAPRDVRSEMDAASIANTRAWLQAHPDTKRDEPTFVVTPPPPITDELVDRLRTIDIEHHKRNEQYPMPTAEESAEWLRMHPASERADDSTTIPFKVDASKEPANMTTKTIEHKTRHMSDEPIPGPKPAISGGKTAITQHITKLTLTSDKFGSGESVFQVITLDKYGSHTNQFKESDPVFSAAVAKLLPIDQIQRGARYTVDGKVTWKDVDGWCTATHLEFKEGSTMEPVKASVLDDEFPRDENGEPADDLPWGDDNLKRGTFFARYEKEVWSPRNCPKDRAEAIRKAILVREYGTDSLRGFNKPVDMLLGRLTVAVEAEYPLAMAYFDEKAENGSKNGQGAAPANGSAMEIPEKPSAPVPDEKPRSEPANVPPEVKPAERPANLIDFPKLPTTLTGISILDVPKRLNAHLPPQAYKAIEFGQMSGKTDIDGDCVRDRFDEVFGPMGIGWRINPNPTAGRVEHRSEQRPKMKKGEPIKDPSTGEILMQTWHIVTLVAHTFQYSVIMPDGSIVWTDASTTTDQHDNMDEQYAYRGAMTSFMKQVYRLMGGMNHIVYNEYTHVHAQRELQRKAS